MQAVLIRISLEDAFLDIFFSQELRDSKVQEFINIKQGNMTMKEYSLKFTQLSNML